MFQDKKRNTPKRSLPNAGSKPVKSRKTDPKKSVAANDSHGGRFVCTRRACAKEFSVYPATGVGRVIAKVSFGYLGGQIFQSLETVAGTGRLERCATNLNSQSGSKPGEPAKSSTDREWSIANLDEQNEDSRNSGSNTDWYLRVCPECSG